VAGEESFEDFTKNGALYKNNDDHDGDDYDEEDGHFPRIVTVTVGFDLQYNRYVFLLLTW
jgi:hypothetical protein